MVVTIAKACRIPSRDKHSHKLNTGNLAVHTLTIYRYIAHKRNSLLEVLNFIFIVSILSFRRVLYAVCSLLGISPASEV